MEFVKALKKFLDPAYILMFIGAICTMFYSVIVGSRSIASTNAYLNWSKKLK